jgi:hypothetical protein
MVQTQKVFNLGKREQGLPVLTHWNTGNRGIQEQGLIRLICADKGFRGIQKAGSTFNFQVFFDVSQTICIGNH